MGHFRIALVVPAYNEARTIYDQIEGLSKIGDVIIVNDGSTDNTKAICESAECKLIDLNANCGYDHALETGIKACFDYDFIITTDADGEIPLKNVKQVKEKLFYGFDCVLGVRDHFPRHGEILVNSIVYKKFKIKDIFCGLKGYKVSKIPSDFTLKNSVGSNLALKFLKHQGNVATVPVHVEMREDESRFGKNDLKTNYKLLKVLKNVF